MREIPLTQGMVALVDDEDYERLARHKWCAIKKTRRWYAVTSEYLGNRRSKIVYMHHVILGRPSKNHEVDHVNGNGCDNQRLNLRWATRCQQMSNVATRGRNKSGLKGVHAHSARRWRAQIKNAGKTEHIGLFTSPEDAAKAYDERARELFGEFAWLNFPPQAQVG